MRRCRKVQYCMCFVVTVETTLMLMSTITAVDSNPFLIWMLAYHDIYEQIVTDVDQLFDDDVREALVTDGSVEDAMLFFESEALNFYLLRCCNVLLVDWFLTCNY
jgi:hypothetical protein